jgi:hypothetical protein
MDIEFLWESRKERDHWEHLYEGDVGEIGGGDMDWIYLA